MPPTPDECTNIKIALAKSEQRVDALSERLDEVLEEIKEAKIFLKNWLIFLGKWLSIWFPIIIILAIMGNNALPIILKVIGMETL